MVFSTFLCRAFTAHYLYTSRSYDIPPLCFTAQCGFPTFIWGRSGLPVLSPGASSREAPSTLTPITCQWFQALLADIVGKVCLGGHSPLGYARFLRITIAFLSQA